MTVDRSGDNKAFSSPETPQSGRKSVARKNERKKKRKKERKNERTKQRKKDKQKEGKKERKTERKKEQTKERTNASKQASNAQPYSVSSSPHDHDLLFSESGVPNARQT